MQTLTISHDSHAMLGKNCNSNVVANGFNNGAKFYTISINLHLIVGIIQRHVFELCFFLDFAVNYVYKCLCIGEE